MNFCTEETKNCSASVSCFDIFGRIGRIGVSHVHLRGENVRMTGGGVSKG